VRRTPVLAGVLGLLLGISGCAGLPQRLDWSSPKVDRSNANDPTVASQIPWWRRPAAEAAATDSATELARTSRAKSTTESTPIPGDVWPESRSEWMARNFPLLSRRWYGNTKASAFEPAPSLRPDIARASARPRPASARDADRADDEVRPVDATDDDDRTTRASDSRQPALVKSERHAGPLMPAPSLVPTEPSGDVELDIAGLDSGRKVQANQDDAETHLSRSQPNSSLSVDSTPTPPQTPADGSESAAPAETQSDTALGSDSEPHDEPELETAMASDPAQQPEVAPARTADAPSPVVPPAPSMRRSPVVPAPAEPEQPKAEPSPPPSPPDTPSAPPAPAPAAPAPAVAPAAAQTTAPTADRGRRLVSASSQSIYASPPPMAPPPRRRSFLGLFYIEERTEPPTPPQFPPPTFPTTYFRAAVRSDQVPRSDQVLPAPQAPYVLALPATQPAKKPCVLTAWFQKFKVCGRGPGCHHGGSAPCCAGCTCHTGTIKSVAESPRKTVAFRAAAPPPAHSNADEQPPATRSTGTEAGDVTEEWKLFERVSFESFDKAPQG
jgi:hypothetical protein